MMRRIIISFVVTFLVFGLFAGGVFAFLFSQQAAIGQSSVLTASPADPMPVVVAQEMLTKTDWAAAATVDTMSKEVPAPVALLNTASLHAGPSSSYDLVGLLGAGDTVMLKASNVDRTWYQSESGAWISVNALATVPTHLPVSDAVSAEVVKPALPVNLVLPTVTPTPAPTPVPVWTGPISNDYAILRSGPGTTFEQTSMALPGAPLPIVAKNQAGDWYQLEDGSWVAGFLIANKAPDVPVSTNIPAPPAGARDLEVTFSYPKYQCLQSAFGFENIAGELWRPWVYRSFQIDMSIHNLNTTPLRPIYKPTRWIITDGVTEFVETISWQAVKSGVAADRQQTLHYDDDATETWYMVSLGREDWVKAVEFEWNGQVYRTEFDLTQARNEANYKDCGEAQNISG